MIKICSICNRNFPNRKGRNSPRSDQKYCSKECWHKSVITVNKVNCIECGKEFRPKTLTKANKFCSSKCYWSNMKKEYNGEKCNAWEGGITKINKLERGRFRREIQPIIFERDDYTCQICKIKGKDMQVDHIKSWKDYPELRFELNNCRTLCMCCHYKITFNKKMPKEIKKWGHNLTQKIK